MRRMLIRAKYMLVVFTQWTLLLFVDTCRFSKSVINKSHTLHVFSFSWLWSCEFQNTTCILKNGVTVWILCCGRLNFTLSLTLDLLRPRFHWAVQFGLAWYGMQLFAFPLSKGCQRVPNNRTLPYLFRSPFHWGTKQSHKESQEGGAIHTAVCWLQAGKNLNFGVVVKLLIYHFSKFRIFFKLECYLVDSTNVVSSSK